MTSSVVRFAALLLTTLVVGLYRLVAATVGAVAWWVSTAPPATTWPEHHGDDVAVFALRPPMCRSARTTARRWLLPVVGAALGPPRRGVLHRPPRTLSRDRENRRRLRSDLVDSRNPFLEAITVQQPCFAQGCS